MTNIPDDINREWLDEKFLSVHTAIETVASLTKSELRSIRKDVNSIQDKDKARSLAVYTAVVGAVVALVGVGAITIS
jgi:hypothetical protein